MRPYLAILSARFRTLLQYRSAALAGFGTQLFWGLIRMMIFSAFYASTTAPQPMSLEAVVGYVWLGQAFLVLLPFRADGELQEMIRTGAVAYELLRPVDTYGLWFARTVANRTAPAVLRAAPMLVIATLTGWLDWPGPAGLASFAAAMVGAVAVSSAFSMLMNVSLLWTLHGRGLNSVVAAAMFLLSGMIVPLPLFPEFLQPLLQALPFRAIIDLPFRLFTADLPPGALPGVLAHQWLWTAALVATGYALLRRGLRRVVVQGG